MRNNASSGHWMVKWPSFTDRSDVRGESHQNCKEAVSHQISSHLHMRGWSSPRQKKPIIPMHDHEKDVSDTDQACEVHVDALSSMDDIDDVIDSLIALTTATSGQIFVHAEEDNKWRCLLHRIFETKPVDIVLLLLSRVIFRNAVTTCHYLVELCFRIFDGEGGSSALIVTLRRLENMIQFEECAIRRLLQKMALLERVSSIQLALELIRIFITHAWTSFYQVARQDNMLITYLATWYQDNAMHVDVMSIICLFLKAARTHRTKVDLPTLSDMETMCLHACFFANANECLCIQGLRCLKNLLCHDLELASVLLSNGTMFELLCKHLSRFPFEAKRKALKIMNILLGLVDASSLQMALHYIDDEFLESIFEALSITDTNLSASAITLLTALVTVSQIYPPGISEKLKAYDIESICYELCATPGMFKYLDPLQSLTFPQELSTVTESSE